MIVAIDPGDRYVGVATCSDLADSSWTTTPDGICDWLMANSASITDLIVEEYRLYPWKSKEQAFSEFDTPQLIGKIKLIHRLFMPNSVMVFQPATIKKPTEAIMRGRKISNVGTRHAKDAKLHLYYYTEHNHNRTDKGE